MSVPFVHLHNHSHFSLNPIDSSSHVDELVRRTAELDMSAIALTDHGVMSGAVQLWRHATKQGVRPIVGCELYICDDHLVKTPKTRGYNHLIALAVNDVGYRNLCTLTSLGFLEGFYYKPRISKGLLARHAEGIVFSSACLAGEVARVLRHPELDEQEAIRRAVALATGMADLVGEDRYFLELQDHGIAEQRLVNERLFRVAEQTGIPLIATNDCHFVYETDFGPHRSLKCVGMHMQVDDLILDPSKHVYVPDHHLKSYESMLEIASRYGKDEGAFRDAIHRTAEIAERFDFSFTSGQYFFPEFREDTSVSIHDLFRDEVLRGFEAMAPQFDATRMQEYYSRLFYEMGIISTMGFESYFLVVADFIRYAKEQGIPVGPGRGSAAGSLVSYVLGITGLDPIRFDLLFERFLNPARVSMPDIDIDFSKRRRQEVIDYVVEKYGRDNVAQIITFGSLRARAVLNDLGRVYGLSLPESQELSRMIPDTPGDPYDLKRSWEEFPDLRAKIQSSVKLRQLWDDALRLENTNRHASIHAAGIVITPDRLTNHVPLFRSNRDEAVAASYDMRDLESIGLVKMDFLGLKTLDLIEDCLQMVERRIPTVREAFAKLDLDDPKLMKVFAEGHTKGLFQFESPGMRGYLVKLHPQKFEHLVAMNALFRPGPMDSGMTDQFIERKNGREPVVAIHPALNEILEPTYGVLVYQEQVMEAVRKLAGMELGDADILRKAMGKKDASLMDEQLKRFIDGGVANGHTVEQMQEVATAIQTFARYGFNRSHAAAYAYIAVQTAWLKTYFPLEFMACLLTNETEDNKPDKVVEYVGETIRMDIPILPPDVNYSEQYFTIEEEGAKRWIRFGLAGIKGAGAAACEKILDERRAFGSFRSFPEFVRRANVGSNVIEALVKGGATESMRGNRATHVANIPQLIDRKKKAKRKQAVGQMALDLVEHEEILEADMAEIEEWDGPTLSLYEKETLGVWLVQHPVRPFRDQVQDDLSILGTKSDVPDPKGMIEVIAVILGYRVRKVGQNAKTLGLIEAADLSATTTDVLLWGEAENEKAIRSRAFEVGNIVKIKGPVRSFGDRKRLHVRHYTVLQAAPVAETSEVDPEEDPYYGQVMGHGVP